MTFNQESNIYSDFVITSWWSVKLFKKACIYLNTYLKKKKDLCYCSCLQMETGLTEEATPGENTKCFLWSVWHLHASRKDNFQNPVMKNSYLSSSTLQ